MHAAFLLSAASSADFPTNGLPEIAMVGRSNVGKSSLINALVGRKMARTSAAPGKTRLANYYLVESHIPGRQSGTVKLYLVDLPGYGYARGGSESAEAFELLTRQYFDDSDPRRRLSGVLHLIDSRHPNLPQDSTAYDWLLRAGLRIAIVATKIDKLSRADQNRALATLAKYGSPVIATSASDGTGLRDVWRAMLEWVTPADTGR